MHTPRGMCNGIQIDLTEKEKLKKLVLAHASSQFSLLSWASVAICTIRLTGMKIPRDCCASVQ